MSLGRGKLGLVNEVIQRLMELGATRVVPLEGIAERVVFSLPHELARKRRKVPEAQRG